MGKHSKSCQCSNRKPSHTSSPLPAPITPAPITPAPNSPPYVIDVCGQSRMQFAIFNQTKLVSRKLLRRTLKVIQDQIDNHFYRYYGITSEFRVFTDYCEIEDWTKYVYILLVDELTPAAARLSAAAGIISGVHVQVDEIKMPLRFLGVWGADINFYIDNAPPIPNGVSYAIIPMGTADSGYGVYYASTLNDPHLPPTFEGLFSLSFDHETLTLLSNPTQNDFTSFFGRTNDPTFFFFFPKELPDATEFNPGYQSEKYPNLYLSNFTFPTFWNPYGQDLGPFDLLGILKEPLLPYTGQTGFLYADNTGIIKGYILFSFPAPEFDPNDFYILDLGDVFKAEPSPPVPTITSAVTTGESPTLETAIPILTAIDVNLQNFRTKFLTRDKKFSRLTPEMIDKLTPFIGSPIQRDLMKYMGRDNK